MGELCGAVTDRGKWRDGAADDSVARTLEPRSVAWQRLARDEAARPGEDASLFAALHRQAVWVPVFHEVRYAMKLARRVGSVNDLLDPTHFINYERLSVKK